MLPDGILFTKSSSTLCVQVSIKEELTVVINSTLLLCKVTFLLWIIQRIRIMHRDLRLGFFLLGESREIYEE